MCINEKLTFLKLPQINFLGETKNDALTSKYMTHNTQILKSLGHWD